MSVLVFIKMFQKKGERCRTKYLEGTVVARGIPEYLEGTTEELEMVMCD
jgi:hypothetical protein